ncbi:MAG: PD-(D/E)XK nuclease family protein [Actinomycetota bacterium]|nr:PD-(D/E)XK nuclease family protein [Actinomycetota bacterium]
MPRVVATPAGSAARTALRDQIAAAKAHDALAPVTVAVPSPYAGLSLRRLLGSQPGGLVNVAFLPLARIAELLGAPSLAAAGRRPVSSAIRREALRVLLCEGGGLFGAIAGHPTTIRALDRTLADLRLCPPDSLARLEQASPRAAEIVNLYGRLRSRLESDWYDEHDLATAAADAVRAGCPALADLGQVIVFCPRRPGPSTAALIAALGEGATVIDTSAAERTTPPTGDVIIGCADPDEEVRAVIRGVMERLARPRPTPLHRMAILYPAGTPYATLAHQQLAAAGIPHNGPAARTLSHTVAGRALLGLLDLGVGNLGRNELATWLASAPVIEEAGGTDLVPAARWDTLSRRAGVVAGPAQWKERLDTLVADLRQQARRLHDDGLDAGDDDEERHQRRQRIERDIATVDRLQLFVEELATALDPGEHTTWGQLSAWAYALLHRYLGGARRQRHWPDEEQESFDDVGLVLERLGGLDGIGGATDLAAFHHAVALELEAPAGRLGTFGDGVFLAPLSAARATDFDTVFVVGLAEGTLPRPGREDALLPDRERRVARRELPLRADRLADEHADYLAALATAAERVLLWPRVDLRAGRQRLPSRWLLDTASRMAGRPVFSGDLAALAAGGDANLPVHHVASFESGVRQAREPCSVLDHDLATLLQWKAAGGDVAGHFLVTASAVLAAGMAAVIGRDSAEFTRFDGNVPAGAADALAAGALLSATSLQTYAACPLRYFLSKELGLEAEDKPEDVLTIGAMDKGTLVHAILEDYVASLLAGEPRSLERLLAMAEARFTEAEAKGLTGQPVLWRYERQVMVRDLVRAHTLDAGTTPLAAELAFGMDGHEPVTLTLPDGRSISFRGKADRVDRDTTGALVVTDYKTGRANGYDAINKDPVDRGTKLQLPLYGLAARQRFGEEGGRTPVRSRYWVVSEKGAFAEFPIELTEGVLERFHKVLGVIVEGITAGNFPARPGDAGWKGPENCGFCDMGSLCQEDRERQWERKKAAPALAAYVELAEGNGEGEVSHG